MNVLDLFSGIGGFALGLERAGFKTVAFCEIDPFCRAVLKKHWPNVLCYDDVTELTAVRLAADGILSAFNQGRLASNAYIRHGDTEEQIQARRDEPRLFGIDIICGGFPCQDISVAGKGAGIEGERSGLWKEYARIIGEVRPRHVIVENVSALLGRGLGVVLGDLAALGYDAEWHCIPASAVGAPHRRDRLWIVANASERRCGGTNGGEIQQPGRTETVGGSEELADTDKPRLERWIGASLQECAEQRIAREGSPSMDDAIGRHGAPQEQIRTGRDGAFDASWWFTEPNVGRVAHGVPARVDRLRSLGNAVVPQITEIIGRAIMESDK